MFINLEELSEFSISSDDIERTNSFSESPINDIRIISILAQ